MGHIFPSNSAAVFVKPLVSSTDSYYVAEVLTKMKVQDSLKFNLDPHYVLINREQLAQS